MWEKMGFTDGSKCDILGMWRGNVIPRLQDVGGVYIIKINLVTEGRIENAFSNKSTV